jgi:hypothetical protein
LATDYDSLENLKTALATFDNTNMDLELIASTELWDVFAQGYCVYGVKNVHGIRPFLSSSIKHRLWQVQTAYLAIEEALSVNRVKLGGNLPHEHTM